MNTAIAPIRIGLAQVNPTVGNLSGNRELILKFARHAKSGGAHIVLFPEMVLTGYPVEDLAMRPSFRDGSRRAINELALALAGSEFEDLVSVVGYLDESESGSPQNAIAIIYRGEIKARYIKHHLPNYGVFDEFRNFTPGNKSLIARIHGIDVGFAICQDIWEDGGPVAELANRGAGLLLVPNGSPYEKAKRIETHMSYQILTQDENWESEMDKVLITVPIVGCAFNNIDLYIFVKRLFIN